MVECGTLLTFGKSFPETLRLSEFFFAVLPVAKSAAMTLA
jgi:hypothetical protein